jgi:hypothetical protein
MWPSFVVVLKPLVEVGLQLFEIAIDLAPKRNAVKLVEHGPVEALDDTIGLWALGPRASVVDVRPPGQRTRAARAYCSTRCPGRSESG